MKEQLNLKKLNETFITALLESTLPFFKKNPCCKKQHQLKPKVKQDNYVESVSCGIIHQEHSPTFGKNYHYSC